MTHTRWDTPYKNQIHLHLSSNPQSDKVASWLVDSPDQPLRRKPPSDSTYNRRRKRPNKWLINGVPSTTAKSVGIVGRSPLDTTARNELHVMGQDGQRQYHSNQHADLQQQVRDFMSGTGFFEQPDIGRYQCHRTMPF